MSTIDYSNFIMPTGYWSGSNFAAPEYLKDYQLIASPITDLDRSNPIINFSFDLIPGDDNYNFSMLEASGKLKIIPMDALDLPFDEAYVDISDYNDYIVVKNNSGVWVNNGDLGAPASFSIAYTSGGFWAMGTTEFESPGVIFKAYPTGIGDYSYDSIVSLNWIPIVSSSIVVGDQNNCILNANDDPSGYSTVFEYSFDLWESPAENITITFDDNGQSWTRRRLVMSQIYNLTGITINGLANNTQMEQSIVYTGGVDLFDYSIIEFYWSGNILYKEISPNPNGLPAPAPFNNSAFNTAGYGTATVYANEPMIAYEVINDHSIRITTTAEEVAALIPPLRKLYVNFSGITP